MHNPVGRMTCLQYTRASTLHVFFDHEPMSAIDSGSRVCFICILCVPNIYIYDMYGYITHPGI